MNSFWQTVVASGLVAGAASYLAWRGWRVMTRSRHGGSCGGGCGNCAHKHGGEKPLVPLEPPRASHD